MNIIQHISVKPSLPRAIGRLDELAHNLVWSWLPGAVDLFEAIDPEIWSATNHNPILLLSEASQDRLDQVAKSSDYQDRLSDVLRSFDEYMSADARTWLTSIILIRKVKSSHISVPNTDCTNHCPFTAAAWGFCQATILKKPATWVFHSWDWFSLPTGLLPAAARFLRAGSMRITTICLSKSCL